AWIAEQMGNALVLEQRQKCRAAGDAVLHVSSCCPRPVTSRDDGNMTKLDGLRQGTAIMAALHWHARAAALWCGQTHKPDAGRKSRCVLTLRRSPVSCCRSSRRDLPSPRPAT